MTGRLTAALEHAQAAAAKAQSGGNAQPTHIVQEGSRFFVETTDAYGDAYKVCRYVKHYYEKNGYLPNALEMPCGNEFLKQLEKNEVVDVLPLYDGGPPVKVALTDKGRRMASVKSR